MPRGGGKKGLKTKAFTLSEVLITLVIIGVIAAITVPSIIVSSKEKENAAKFKKAYSLIEQALKRAQIDEGLIGDNKVIFDASKTNFEIAAKLGNYLYHTKICENVNGCSSLYADEIKYGSKKSGVYNLKYTSAIALNDGTILYVEKGNDTDNCIVQRKGYEVDEDGNFKTLEDGVTKIEIPGGFTSYVCALVYVDVNGLKKPNKFGDDIITIGIEKSKIGLKKDAMYGYSVEKEKLYGF